MEYSASRWIPFLLIPALVACQGTMTFAVPEADDDDVDLDPWGDDDDSADPGDAPPYEGTLVMDDADLWVDCAADDAGTAGAWGFRAELVGWAALCWVELHLDGYCEGYDGQGNPCEEDGVDRPGWPLVQGPFGHSEELGYWDVWALELPFEDAWPPQDGVSAVPCADGPELRFCCADAAQTDHTDCRDVDGP